MLVRKLEKHEIPEAMSLVWDVFSEFEAPEYSDEGIENFRKTICNEEFINMIAMYGAFYDDKLVGVSATRNAGNHIALFFVRPQYHKRGIGRAMFEEILKNSSADMITVNSSPYAEKIYSRLGFTADSGEQSDNGIRFVPMVYKKDDAGNN